MSLTSPPSTRRPDAGPAPAAGARLILASASPRRRWLLELLGLDHRVIPSGIEESPGPGEAPVAFAERAAREKAVEVAARHPGDPVLAADTVVELDGRILGKPRDPGEALRMLEELAGRRHRVHTAVAVALGERLASLVDTAVVEFLPAVPGLLEWYAATGEPLDKAGAYAVQGAGGLLVAGVEGHPHTVVGLPTHRLAELLAAVGLDLLPLLGAAPRA